MKTQEKKPLFTIPLQTVDDDRVESIEDLIARYEVPFGSLAPMKTQTLREFFPLILDAFFKEEKGKVSFIKLYWNGRSEPIMSKSMTCKLLDGQMVIVTCRDTEGRCLLLDGDEREILDVSGIERFEVDDGYIDASWNKRAGLQGIDKKYYSQRLRRYAGESVYIGIL